MQNKLGPKNPQVDVTQTYQQNISFSIYTTYYQTLSDQSESRALMSHENERICLGLNHILMATCMLKHV